MFAQPLAWKLHITVVKAKRSIHEMGLQENYPLQKARKSAVLFANNQEGTGWPGWLVYPSAICISHTK